MYVGWLELCIFFSVVSWFMRTQDCDCKSTKKVDDYYDPNGDPDWDLINQIYRFCTRIIIMLGIISAAIFIYLLLDWIKETFSNET